MLFLLPFAIAGVVMTGLTVWTVVDWQRMKSWQETPAELLSLKLNRGEKSHRIRAKYAYTCEGERYTNTRVALHQMGDNFGDYQERNFRNLKRSKTAQRKVVAYVNTSNPREAVLLRDLRLEVLLFKASFGMIFGLLGVGGLIGIRYCGRDTKQQLAWAQQSPDEPWLWHNDWREGIITSSGGSSFYATLVLAALWNCVSWPAAGAMYFDKDRPEPWVMMIAGGFVLIGLGLSGLALMMFVRWRRFPHATFRMATKPGVIGGRLAGVIIVPRRVQPSDGFRLSLACTRTVRTGKHSVVRVLWEDQRTVVRTLDEQITDQTAIPVAFTIPSACVPSDPHATEPVKWSLKVEANMPGPDLVFPFEVPVFSTPDSQEGIEADGEALTEYERDESLDSLLAVEKIIVEHSASQESVTYRIPAGRNRGMAIGMSAFTVIWLAVAVGLLVAHVWFIAMVTLFFGVLIVLGSLHLWLVRAKLTIRGSQWTHSWGWWPMWWRTREFTSDQIGSVVIEQNTQSGSKSYGDLVVKLKDGGRVKLVSHLSSRVAERKWASELRHRAAITPEPMARDMAEAQA